MSQYYIFVITKAANYGSWTKSSALNTQSWDKMNLGL